MTNALGPLLHSFFEDHLKVQKGLRPGSIRSYRDALRLFICFAAENAKKKLSRLSLSDLTYERTQQFLRGLEEQRGNRIRTRNHRLAALRAFFEYIGSRSPEWLDVIQRIAAIPMKRTPPPETQFLDRDEMSALLRALPREGRHALRDRALIVFLYNTGARVQEVADLRVGHLDLEPQPRVQLHGKGDKWRMCPLWNETVQILKQLVGAAGPETPVFSSGRGKPLTRFGIYKIVRRRTRALDKNGARPRRVHPHLFRHTAAVHLLESGVEVNVIRGWLGHVSLDTTNRYAEITLRTKEAALRACEPPSATPTSSRSAVWKDDQALLNWLNAL